MYTRAYISSYIFPFSFCVKYFCAVNKSRGENRRIDTINIRVWDSQLEMRVRSTFVLRTVVGLSNIGATVERSIILA